MDAVTAFTIDKGQKNTQLLIQPQYSPMPVEDQIAAERDVGVPLPVFRIEEFDQDGMLRERRHGQRSDELRGQLSHYDFHLGACAFEQAAEYGLSLIHI